MDGSIAEIRGRIIDTLALRVAVGASVIGGITLLTLLVSGVGFLAAAPWALLTAQAVAVAVVAVEMLSGPMRPSDVIDFLADHEGYELAHYRPGEGDDDGGDAVVEDLASLGLAPMVTVVESGSEEAVYDVYLTERRLVGALVGRLSGDTVLVSELDDGGLLVTAQQLMAVDERARIVACPGADRAELAVRHREVLFEIARDHGVRAVPLRAVMALELLDSEVDTWRRLGPWMGSMLRLNRGHNRGLGVAVGQLENRYAVDGRPPAIADLDAVVP